MLFLSSDPSSSKRAMQYQTPYDNYSPPELSLTCGDFLRLDFEELNL
jgi:hypothetical protein